MAHLLEIEDLRVTFHTEDGVVQAVDGVSFCLDAGEVLAVVGESGSGKSVTALTLLGLTRSANAVVQGSARLDGAELLGASDESLRHIRGKEISMIFQDPMSALNPVQRVTDQVVEQIRAHDRVSRRAAIDRAVMLMEKVGITRAKERGRSFPHEFSGGMRQRVMIAMALSCSPRLLIADEPTTALDVTIQAQILAEIEELRRETGVAVILVTHDLGVVAEVADRVLVMYAGRVVEEGSIENIFTDPQHPYTWGLLGSVPRVDRARPDRLPTIAGQPPSLLRPPRGCHFGPRCPHMFAQCQDVPPLEPKVEGQPGHLDRCWLALSDKRRLRLVGDAIGLAAPPVVCQPRGHHPLTNSESVLEP